MIAGGCRVPTDALVASEGSPGRRILSKRGEVVQGVDFRGCYVDIKANDVTIQDCLFDASAGFFTVRQYPTFSGLTVAFCTFDGGKTGKGAGTSVWGNAGRCTVRDSVFVGLPSDAINISNGEAICNAIGSLGWADGAHADGIVVPVTTGPILIASNIIDGTPDGAPAGMNHLVQVLPNTGPITNGVEIITNVLIGGTYSVAVYSEPEKHMPDRRHAISNVSVLGNQIGGWMYGPLYPKGQPSDLRFERNVERGSGRALAGLQLARGAN